MTLFPAIIVFAIVFLSFSKKVLSQQEEPRELSLPKSNSTNIMLDPNTELLKYELMKRSLEKRAQRKS